MGDADPFRLEGKVALVTGAGRGIGAATALAIAERGADVGLVARTEPELSDVADRIRSRGRRAAVIVEDLSAAPDVRSVVDALVTEARSWTTRSGSTSPARSTWSRRRCHTCSGVTAPAW
jgi:short-subunit dehydrogenase